jgi:hypothetical protein
MKHRRLRQSNVRELLAHDYFVKGFMFLMSERFCEKISPIEICVYFDQFDMTIFDLVMEMMPFYGNMLCSGLGAFNAICTMPCW